jgi:Family of unknown function (DUF6325)
VNASDVLAPVAYLAVEFPSGSVTGEGFAIVHRLVERGIISVLDLEFVATGPDGTVRAVPLDDIEHDADVDITQWQGTYSGLLGQDDIDALAAVMAPGSLTGIVIYENVWAAPLLAAMDERGARLVGSGSIDPDDLIQALNDAPL